ncbi:MAG: GNAT family N-acetyltransferase [Woeseiaceae bacterium]
MSQLIRMVSPSELDDLLALNESEVPHVGTINIEQMQWFARNADYFRVVEKDHQIAGFLIGLRPGSSYQSRNYRWFCDRYDDFAYVDRVAVAKSARGLGVASKLYADFAATLSGSCKALTCEVNILPPNEGSMKFHARLGFREVGSLTSDDGSKKVALLVKDL